MKALVTGAAGLLGTDLVRAAHDRGWEVVGLDRGALDVTDADAVVDTLDRHAPDVVLHCAAYTAVDRAESEPHLARSVNVDGVGHTAEAAARVGATFVSFSTDFVFDGEAESPYLPGDSPKPLSVYGRTKLEGEQAAAGSGADHLVVRTSWLYGAGGRSFVTTILRRAEAGEPLRVVDDQRGRPTWARNLAVATLELVDEGARGTWHVTDGGACSWVELAQEALRIRRLTATVEVVTTEALGAPAPRPRYSVLDVSATEELLGRAMVPWPEALSEFLGGSAP